MIKLFKKKNFEPVAYNLKQVKVYAYELELLRKAVYNRGQRADSIKKIKDFTLWRLENGK